MSKFNRFIGANLRYIRLAHGLTLTELADKMIELGCKDISGQAIGHWENGRRGISAEYLMYLSLALHCPYSSFYRGIDKRIEMNSVVEQMMLEFKALPEKDQQTVLDVATVFDGDRLALIRYLQLCYLDTPREYWREIVAHGLHIRQQAEDDGVVESSPEIEYVIEAWRKLYG